MKPKLAIMMLIIAAIAIAAVAGRGDPSSGKKPVKDYDIAVTDQASDRVLVFQADAAEWSGSKAKWSWAPDESNGFADLMSAWGSPTDARVRQNEKWGGQWMVVTDSRGLAAIIPYPKANGKKWGLNVGGNPHSAELLPDGNIAVAASTGGWVRVYASSQGPASESYAEYVLPGAHAVLWDPRLKLLWTAGDEYLAALRVEGTAAEPKLSEARKIALPTKHAHAVEPVYGDSGRLWIATGTKVYQYVKSTSAFDSGYPGNEAISRAGVKSIGDQPSGRVVETVPDNAKKPPGKCTANSWCTDTVDFFLPDAKRSLDGSALYKARVWNPNYQ
ncbi:DUF6528 family protein [Paenibacillus sp. P25]|nr:DUF6528 family protein [Paenibacillus sp. P25]